MNIRATDNIFLHLLTCHNLQIIPYCGSVLGKDSNTSLLQKYTKMYAGKIKKNQ